MEFEEFTRTELAGLLRYATALCGCRHLAEDVVQEVLSRAMAQWWRIQQTVQPMTYVRRMITNEFLSVHRTWGRSIPHAGVSPAGSRPDPAQVTADKCAFHRDGPRSRRCPHRDHRRRTPRPHHDVLTETELLEIFSGPGSDTFRIDHSMRVGHVNEWKYTAAQWQVLSAKN